MNYKRRNWWTVPPEPANFNRIKSLLTREGLPENTGIWYKYHYGWKNCTYILSVRTDPFPYIEKELKHTLKIMRLFEGKSLGILTKNPALITSEYLDLGIDLAVSVSFSAPDKRFEPNAPSVESRLQAVDWLASQKIPVGIRLTPTFADVWDDFSLKMILSRPWYCLTIDCNLDPRFVKQFGLDERKEFDFAWHVTEIARSFGIPVHHSEVKHRGEGCKSCLPPWFPHWQGTCWEPEFEIPDCVKIISGARGKTVPAQSLRLNLEDIS